MIGVVLVAVGHHNYGRMCNMLICSINKTTTDVEIIVIVDSNTENIIRKDKFDNVSTIKIEKSFYHIDGYNQWGKVKLSAVNHIKDYWDKWVYLDVDSFVTPNHNLHMFNFDSDICIQHDPNFPISRDLYNNYTAEWASEQHLHNLKEYYSNIYNEQHNTYYYVQGSIFGGNNTQRCKGFYNFCLELHDVILKTENYSPNWLLKAVPDELVVSTSLMILNEKPIMWDHLTPIWDKKIITQILSKILVTFPVGGNNLPGMGKDIYNMYARYYSSLYGIPAYQWLDKKYFK